MMKYLLYIGAFLYICMTPSVASKFGINTIGTASSFIMLVMFLYYALITKTDYIFKRFKEEFTLYAIALILIILRFLINGSEGAKQVFFFLVVPASFSILLGLQNLNTRKGLIVLIIAFFVAECALAIYERTTYTHLFPLRDKAVLNEDDLLFRSTAFMGHPLTNAITVSIIMGFIATSYFNQISKILLLLLGVVALLCFNARGASLAWLVIGGIYLINYFKTHRIKVSNVTMIIVGITIISGVISALIFQYGLGGRLTSEKIMDGSAMSRLQVFAAFNYVNTRDFWLGDQTNYVPIMKKLGAAGVENSYIVMILNYGMIMALILFFAFFLFIKSLLSKTSFLTKTIIVLSFIGVGSLNNVLALDIPWSLFILCAHSFIPLTHYYEKKEKTIKRKLLDLSLNKQKKLLRSLQPNIS